MSLLTPSSKVARLTPIHARQLLLNTNSNSAYNEASIMTQYQKPEKISLDIGERQEMGSITNNLLENRQDQEVYVYICQECDNQFNDKKMLQRHRKISHKVQASSLMDRSFLVLGSSKKSEKRKARTEGAVREQEKNCAQVPLAIGNPAPLSKSLHNLIIENSDKRRTERVGILRLIQPPAHSAKLPTTPTHSTAAHLVRFQTPSDNRRTIEEDKVSRGVHSVIPPTPGRIPTECPLCHLILPTKGAYKNHLEMHEGKKPFMCPECYWGYETEIKLLEHHSRHSKEAIFKCGGCTKKYKTSRGLKQHQILKNCNSPTRHRSIGASGQCR